MRICCLTASEVKARDGFMTPLQNLAECNGQRECEHNSAEEASKGLPEAEHWQLRNAADERFGHGASVELSSS